jgi:WD40 repeat protein
VTGGRGATLHFLNNSNSEIQIKAHLLHIHSLSLHPEQNLLLSSSMDKTIKLWDFENKTLLKVIDKEKYNGHTSSVNKILWFDRNRFISCSDDRTIKCFEIIQP